MLSKRRLADRQAYLAALCRTVPYHVVESVLADPTADAAGERRFDGTVMFVDLVGFTSMCEAWAGVGEAGLSRLSQVLDRFFTVLLEQAIFPYRGYVVQFGGDSVTVVFHGADHAWRAAASALRARTLTETVGRESGEPAELLRVRVGLASGDVRLPILGDDTQRGVIVAGTPAHRAVELQGKAEPSGVQLDVNTAALVGDAAIGSPAPDDGFVLEDLKRWPPRDPIPELDGRIEEDTERKIELLAPFVPPPLAARLKSMPDGWRIDGELRRVTVVFCEVTGLAGTGLREEARHLARAGLRSFRRYGGVLTKADVAVDGHRMMAVFGLHAPTDNDAERALLSALETTATFQSAAARWELPLSFKVGVHTGPVYFGAIGSSYRHDVTVVGDTVNVAARIAHAAERFQVLASEDVLDDVQGVFQYTSLDPVRGKGKRESVRVAAVHAPAGERAHYLQRRKRQRYVAGRSREAESLTTLVGHALDGQGRVLGICGEAGAGKSFILSSLIDRWVDGGGLGLLGRCRYAQQSVPLAPVSMMFDSFLGLAPDDSEGVRSARAEAALSRLDLGAHHAVLAEFLRRDPADESTAIGRRRFSVDAREPLLDAIEAFVRARVREEPLLYVLEDAQWADEVTLEMATRLARFERGQRFCFVVTYRPDAALEGLQKLLDKETVLERLSLRQSAELVRHLLGATTVDDVVASFLWQRSQGNPGQLSELVRFLRDRSLLQVRAGAVVVPAPGIGLLEDAVPATLAQLTLARLDQLGELERRLIRTASAIGQSFPRAILGEVVTDDLDEERLETGVVALLDEGVLVQEPSTRPAYRFREDVTRAVAYRLIPSEDRREVHRRIADALEKVQGPDKNKSAVTLALHRERAGELAKAAEWYGRAIQLAALAGLDVETRDLVVRWEEVVAGLPPDERPAKAVQARMAVRKLIATARRGSPTETLEQARRIRSAHWGVLDAAGKSLVDLWLADALLALGQPDQANARLERVYASVADAKVRAEAARLLGTVHARGERYDDAMSWLDKATELLDDDGNRTQRVELDRAALLAASGRLDEARARYASVRDAAQRRDHVRVSALALRGVAECDFLAGDVDVALDGFRSAIAVARALGSRASEAVEELMLGRCLLWAQRADEAKPHLERAVSLSRDLGHKLVEAEAIVELGAAIGLTEDLAEGTALVEEGFRRAVRGDLRFAEISADLHLLRLAVLRYDVSAVREQLSRCGAHEGHFQAPVFDRAYDELKGRALKLLLERNDTLPEPVG